MRYSVYSHTYYSTTLIRYIYTVALLSVRQLGRVPTLQESVGNWIYLYIPAPPGHTNQVFSPSKAKFKPVLHRYVSGYDAKVGG